MISTSTIIAEDCKVLLDRALLGKDICAFGEDGFGQYGRNDRASWFKVNDIDVEITMDDEDDPTEITGTVALTLEGYDSDVHGYIMTDKNFEIRLRNLLQAAHIDPNCLTWQDNADDQGIWTVVMNLDVGLLMEWA